MDLEKVTFFMVGIVFWIPNILRPRYLKIIYLKNLSSEIICAWNSRNTSSYRVVVECRDWSVRVHVVGEKTEAQVNSSPESQRQSVATKVWTDNS